MSRSRCLNLLFASFLLALAAPGCGGEETSEPAHDTQSTTADATSDGGQEQDSAVEADTGGGPDGADQDATAQEDTSPVEDSGDQDSAVGQDASTTEDGSSAQDVAGDTAACGVHATLCASVADCCPGFECRLLNGDLDRCVDPDVCGVGWDSCGWDGVDCCAGYVCGADYLCVPE